ncbi:hypothetical protein D3C80_1859050 [compost metagenome]
MQLAALDHVAVERITVDRVVDEVTFAVIQRQFPELGHGWHVGQVKGQRVAMVAMQRLTAGIAQGKAAGVRTRRNRTEYSDIAVHGTHQPVTVAITQVGGE